MALRVRGAETDRLVRTSAARKRIPLTEAIKLAVRNEPDRDAASPSLWERLRPPRERVAARPATGPTADKAFFDDLSGG